MSFLLQNKAILTSVRSAVDNPGAIHSEQWAGGGERGERGWERRETDRQTMRSLLKAGPFSPGLAWEGFTKWSASFKGKVSTWQISTTLCWKAHCIPPPSLQQDESGKEPTRETPRGSRPRLPACGLES